MNARYETPSAVARAVQAQYGITLTRQMVEYYDPNKAYGKHLAQRYRALFDEARCSHQQNSGQQSLASSTGRWTILQRTYERAEEKDDSKTMLACLDRAERWQSSLNSVLAAALREVPDLDPQQLVPLLKQLVALHRLSDDELEAEMRTRPAQEEETCE